MDIFSIFSLLGGLAFFLYGMNVMSSGLEKVAGGSFEKIIRKMTSSIWKSLLLGAGITVAIQSSSAITVMLVGLVNSGIMKLSQTIGVIMGSNVGTTFTAWILSLTGIESDNKLIQFFKPENFTPIVALVGIIMIMVSKKKRYHDLGGIFIGFSILIFGMNVMSDAVSPLKDMPQFSGILTAFTNPFIGVLVGAVFTAVIQSSAASIGILQALSMTGSITYGIAFPIIIGQNIGTCITAVLSSIGVNKNAKRVSVVHMAFNILGAAIFLIFYLLVGALFDIDSFTNTSIGPAAIAGVHSVFNLLTTLILLPFTKLLEKIAYFIIKDGDNEIEKFTLVDERLFSTPSVALAECSNATVNMSETAKDAVLRALDLYNKYDVQLAEEVLKEEEKLDKFEDKLGTYLVKLSSKDLSEKDSKLISNLLTSIGDYERMGDHAVNLLAGSEEMYKKGIVFSPEAKAEIEILTSAIKEILSITIDSFKNNSIETAKKVEPLEQVIDNLVAETKKRHIDRLQSGNCTIELGFILSDLLTNCERISDHCSNIAVALIELADNNLDVHKYLNNVKSSGSPEYEMEYSKYKNMFKLS